MTKSKMAPSATAYKNFRDLSQTESYLKSMKGRVDSPRRGVLQMCPCTDASMKGRVNHPEFLAPRFSWGADAD